VFAAQEAAFTLMAFSAQSWQTMASQVESGEDWVNAYQDSIEKISQNWSQGQANFAEIAQDTNRLWQLYMEQWQKFGQPWVTAMGQAPEQFERAMTGDSSALIDLSNLYRETYRQTMGRILSSPYLGPTRELSEKISQGFDSWVEWQTAIFTYQAILLETWKKATAKFMEQLVALAEQGEKIESIQDLLKLWTQEAEEVFTETFRTDDYVLAQGKMLNSAMAYRMKERVIIEEFLQIYDLPTRSELDETHRRIYELRKEVKELKKALLESSQGD
jgi:class III poly(R)-hydroxyalkanoic acid synthase PhaE subunit